MALSYIEIFRRGVWNFFRVELDHVANCEKFEVNVNDIEYVHRVEERYREKYGESPIDENEEKLRLLREK